MMLQNKIHHVDAIEASKIIQEAWSSTSLHLVELQGKEIQSWVDYISRIENAFKFPTKCEDIMDRYFDWIRDLEWLGKDGYVLIIHDFKSFLKLDLPLKKMIIDDYAEIILPWWQEDVEKYVGNGKAKPFNIYLID